MQALVDFEESEVMEASLLIPGEEGVSVLLVVIGALAGFGVMVGLF